MKKILVDAEPNPPYFHGINISLVFRISRAAAALSRAAA